MLYCIADTPPQVALSTAFSRAKRGDVICLHRSVIGRLDMRRELEGEQNTVAALLRLSAITRSVVLAAVRALVDDERYDSVIAFENGKLLGISDRISPRAGFSEGNCLRCYDLPDGRTGVLVGRDFEYPELWRALAASDCKCVHVFDERKMSALDEKLLCAFSFTYGMTAFAHFLDSSAVFSPDGTLKDRSEGCCRSLAAETQSRKPKILGGKPKLLKT